MSELTKRHIGKRILYRNWWSSGAGDEAVVVELSPSRERVCLRHPNGVESWKDLGDIEIVEVLGKKERRGDNS